jgi:hypothetical protein
MTVVARHFKPEGIALGAGLLGLGILATLANLGYVDLLRSARLTWPLVLVIWGAAELYKTFSAGRA